LPTKEEKIKMSKPNKTGVNWDDPKERKKYMKEQAMLKREKNNRIKNNPKKMEELRKKIMKEER